MGAIARKELEELVAWARSGSRKVRVKFKGYRYSLLISRYIGAVDATGRAVPWTLAFGSRSPHDVLSSLPVERVVVDEPGSTAVFNSLEELLKRAGVRR